MALKVVRKGHACCFSCHSFNSSMTTLMEQRLAQPNTKSRILLMQLQFYLTSGDLHMKYQGSPFFCFQSKKKIIYYYKNNFLSIILNCILVNCCDWFHFLKKNFIFFKKKSIFLLDHMQPKATSIKKYLSKVHSFCKQFCTRILFS